MIRQKGLSFPLKILYYEGMNIFLSRYFSVSIFILIFLVSFSSPSTAQNTPDHESVMLSGKGKTPCAVIQEKIREKAGIRKLVKTSIQMGFGACTIVKCSIAGGGNLQEIITGAIEGGSTPDVVSRCALDAGASPDKIGAVLSAVEEGTVCFFPRDEMIPMETAVPGGRSERKYISPSSF